MYACHSYSEPSLLGKIQILSHVDDSPGLSFSMILTGLPPVNCECLSVVEVENIGLFPCTKLHPALSPARPLNFYSDAFYFFFFSSEPSLEYFILVFLAILVISAGCSSRPFWWDISSCILDSSLNARSVLTFVAEVLNSFEVILRAYCAFIVETECCE